MAHAALVNTIPAHETEQNTVPVDQFAHYFQPFSTRSLANPPAA